jgi:hypothetical protein
MTSVGQPVLRPKKQQSEQKSRVGKRYGPGDVDYVPDSWAWFSGEPHAGLIPCPQKQLSIRVVWLNPINGLNPEPRELPHSCG